MDLKRLTPSLAVAPQVAPADMAALAAAGFTTVIRSEEHTSELQSH